MTPDDMRPQSDDRTIPTRSPGRERRDPSVDFIPPDNKPLPWLLELYYRAETDFNRELVARFPNMPVLSLIHTRMVGDKLKLHTALLSTQDGAASVIVEIDAASKAVCFTYALSSMLAFRFTLNRLTDKDRAQWMQEMRTERGEIAFLWDQTRWEHDYLIGVSFKNYTNLFAFSPAHLEAGARLTSEVTHKLLSWLQGLWQADAEQLTSTLPW
jgi:hypothetical protein